MALLRSLYECIFTIATLHQIRLTLLTSPNREKTASMSISESSNSIEGSRLVISTSAIGSSRVWENESSLSDKLLQIDLGGDDVMLLLDRLSESLVGISFKGSLKLVY